MKNSFRIVFLALLCALFAACDRPMGVLDTDKMAHVLADIHVAEAAIGQQMSGLEMEYKRTYYYSIFKKYDITYEEFNRSLEWYSKHPKEFKEVYNITLQLVEYKRDEVEHYVYHPEEDPQNKHTIDTVDLWVRSANFVVTNEQRDSLYFELNDSSYFAKGDKIVWTFYERLSDTIQGGLKIRVHYANAECDSICYSLPRKTTKHRYCVTFATRDTLCPVAIDGWFFVSDIKTIPQIQIDSVKLQLLFNRDKHSISDEQKSNLDSLRLKNKVRDEQVVKKKKESIKSEVRFNANNRQQFLKLKRK